MLVPDKIRLNPPALSCHRPHPCCCAQCCALAVLSAVVCSTRVIFLALRSPDDARGSQTGIWAAVRFSWLPPFAPCWPWALHGAHTRFLLHCFAPKSSGSEEAPGTVGGTGASPQAQAPPLEEGYCPKKLLPYTSRNRARGMVSMAKSQTLRSMVSVQNCSRNKTVGWIQLTVP